MDVCSIFPNTLDFFILDEKDAEDVINFICCMSEKGKGTTEKTAKKEKRKKVYADQASWY